MATCPDGLAEGFGVGAPAHHAICLVLSRFRRPDGVEFLRPGSGMLFYAKGGSSYVVTAGHNVFAHDLARELIGGTVFFARYGQSWAYQRAIENHYVSDEFIRSGNADPQWDFAALRLRLVDDTDVKPIAVQRSAASENPDVLISGYPDEGHCHQSRVPWHCVTSLVSAGAHNFAYPGQPTYRGMSGAPLLRRKDSGKLVSYGLHIRGADQNPGGERALRFSSRVVTRLFSWVGVSA